MKEVYEVPVMEINAFDSEDVIVTSYWGEEDPIPQNDVMETEQPDMSFEGRQRGLLPAHFIC